jgi:hypothetical protein
MLQGGTEGEIQRHMAKKHPRLRWERQDVNDALKMMLRLGLSKMARASYRY